MTLPPSLLENTIEAARNLEAAASQKVLRKPLQVVGLYCLVRHRQIAVAIQRLGLESAYESRVLLRTMIEIYINYAWIRLRDTDLRAERFLKFVPLEKLRILEQTTRAYRPDEYARLKRTRQTEREKVRHLFQSHDTKGKMKWAKSWTCGKSVEAMFTEIQENEKPETSLDLFLYGLYRFFSSAVHGGPLSRTEVLMVVDRRIIASPQPEHDPTEDHTVGAFTLLASSIEAFAEDAMLQDQCHADIRKVSAALQELMPRVPQLNVG